MERPCMVTVFDPNPFYLNLDWVADQESPSLVKVSYVEKRFRPLDVKGVLEEVGFRESGEPTTIFTNLLGETINSTYWVPPADIDLILWYLKDPKMFLWKTEDWDDMKLITTIYDWSYKFDDELYVPFTEVLSKSALGWRTGLISAIEGYKKSKVSA